MRRKFLTALLLAALCLTLSGCSLGRAIGAAIIGDSSGTSSSSGGSSQSGSSSGTPSEWEGDLRFDMSGSLLRLAEGPAINENGNYFVTVSDDTLPYLQGASFRLFADQGDGTMLGLGSDADVIIDWETGYVGDNFTGVWPSLDDGQLISMIMTYQCAEFIAYECPVYYNGQEAMLNMMWEWTDPYDPDDLTGSYRFTDIAWNDGETEIRPGDTVTPVYFLYDEDGDRVNVREGTPYTFSEESYVTNTQLPSGDYHYSLCLEDTQGTVVTSPPAVFFVDTDGSLYYY